MGLELPTAQVVLPVQFGPVLSCLTLQISSSLHGFGLHTSEKNKQLKRSVGINNLRHFSLYKRLTMLGLYVYC